MVKRVLVLGSANCLREDLSLALSFGEYEGVVACKAAGLSWNGNLLAWVSLHPERLASDLAKRRGLRYPEPSRVYGHREAPGVTHVIDYKWPQQKTSGSSGLFALRVAIEEFGATHCVLCGMPLDKAQGRIDGQVRWRGAEAFKHGWLQSLDLIKENTRSMSGWTKGLLGGPTAEWLNESR